MTRFILALLLAACIIAAVSNSAAARDPFKQSIRFAREEQPFRLSDYEELLDPGLRGLMKSAAVDTYCIVWYDFEYQNWQGWTRVDNTEQFGTFFHVDDFAGLEGGDFGGLHALEGAKSMWCGARPNTADPYLCSWQNAPGYGNDWNQDLIMETDNVAGLLTFSYKIAYDTEAGYDSVLVQRRGYWFDEWITLASYQGRGSEVVSHTIPLTSVITKLRFHFVSDGAYSDQDGIHNTDGACIVDSILVSDTGVYSYYEDFEDGPVGAQSLHWAGRPGEAFGGHAGFWNNLQDKDPCGENFSTQIVFFTSYDYPSTEYPGLYDTPYCSFPTTGEGPCQDEMVVSPVIDLTKYSTARNSVQDGTIPPGELASLGGYKLAYSVYRDLCDGDLVFRTWFVRTIDENGCPGPWRWDNILYWGCDEDYLSAAQDIGTYVASGKIQVALGVIDFCDSYYWYWGSCNHHTPAPWYDNVRVYRYNSSGPQWAYRDLDFFQDNFPTLEFQIESYVRADAANDINSRDIPVIRPGDSIVVDCASPTGGGIAADPAGGPAVYMHAKCSYIGPTPLKPVLAGPDLEGSCGTYKSDDGVWTIIQCDSARTPGGVVDNKWTADLNDSLFTRGYMIEYYFTALDVAGLETSLPKWARASGPYFEFTCFPTMNSEFLLVDDYFQGSQYYGPFGGLVELYWGSVFEDILPYDAPADRYDVNGASSGVSNGPGSRAKNRHLTDQYRYIIWDSGDYYSTTISDGNATENSDKSNDCLMLVDWMNLSEHGCGLWVCGDDIAYDLDNMGSTNALTLLSTWCGVDFLADSYFDLTGGRAGGGDVVPIIAGDPEAGVFVHSGVPDSLAAYGGCPVLNGFDVLGTTANGQYALRYPDYGGNSHYAAVASTSLNAGGYAARTMWFGFSYIFLRDDKFQQPPDRCEIARDVFGWMQLPVTICCTGTETPKAYSLAQNFPNPFNPATTIRYDMKARGLVTIRIYDVAGRLVRTVVDEVKDAGSHAAIWDGTNASGAEVASGVYFYQMAAPGFSSTRKTVLLR